MLHKTRIAPTPSGYLHIGNIYSFLITRRLAIDHGAKVLLRIDDADRERTQKVYVQDILDTLRFMHIGWDEGPQTVAEYEKLYSQAFREPLYEQLLQQVVDAGLVFACTCTRTDAALAGIANGYPGTCKNKNLPLDIPNCSWRIDTSKAGTLMVNTLSGMVQATLPKEMTDFIVKKKDGHAGYQLSSLADDTYYNIDLIVRGEDLWPSTIAQLCLADILGIESFRQATFYHHPLLTDASGKKFSKSEGATSIHHLRERGYTREDIYNMIKNKTGQLPGNHPVV